MTIAVMLWLLGSRMQPLLGETADHSISGDWLLKLVGAIFTGAALILGRYWGKKEALVTRLEDPVPEIPTRKVSVPPTWSDHRALVERMARTEADVLRVEGEIKEMRTLQAQQFQAIMQAGAEREMSLSNKLEGVATGIHRRIDEILSPTKTRTRA